MDLPQQAVPLSQQLHPEHLLVMCPQCSTVVPSIMQSAHRQSCQHRSQPGVLDLPAVGSRTATPAAPSAPSQRDYPVEPEANTLADQPSSGRDHGSDEGPAQTVVDLARLTATHHQLLVDYAALEALLAHMSQELLQLHAQRLHVPVLATLSTGPSAVSLPMGALPAGAVHCPPDVVQVSVSLAREFLMVRSVRVDGG